MEILMYRISITIKLKPIFLHKCCLHPKWTKSYNSIVLITTNALKLLFALKQQNCIRT